MKKLEELGISPAPWKVVVHIDRNTGEPYKNINAAGGCYVCDGTTDPDKCMLAAAPEMYKTEHSLVDIVERLMNAFSGLCDYPPQEEVVSALDEAKAALAKAGGEEAKQ